VPSKSQHHEDQYEGPHDLGDQVHPEVADGRDRREDAELVPGIRFGIEVVLVGHPAQQGPDHGPQQLSDEVGRQVGLRTRIARGDQAQRDRRVQMGSGLVGGQHSGVDPQAPAHVDHQESPAPALGARKHGVGHHAAPEQQQHRGPHDL